jgi:uncharacterized membrane-anchored protein YitT (DUF2179 family)
MKPPKALYGVKDDFSDLMWAMGQWRFWRTVVAMVVGLTCFSLSVNCVLIPNHFNASGATGIALALFYLFGKPSVGVFYWALNIPILFVGWRFMNVKVVLFAIIGVVISGTALQLTQRLALPIDDPMMAAILGGTLSGFGVGLYLRYGGSAGGLDIIAVVLRRKFGIPMGQTFISINAINVAAAGILGHSLSLGFYTAVATFVHSTMVDRMQSGFSSRKSALIITSKPEQVSEAILRTLNRGCTFFHGSGGMSKQDLRLIYTVVNFIELARLKEILHGIDSTAFMSVSNVTEVIGNRFISWEEEGYGQKLRGQAVAKRPPPA